MSAFTNGGGNTAAPPAENERQGQIYDETLKRTQEANIDEQTRKELLTALQDAGKRGVPVGDIAARLDAAITNTGPEAQLFKERRGKQEASLRIVNTPGLRNQTTGTGTLLTSEYRKPESDRMTLIGGR